MKKQKINFNTSCLGDTAFLIIHHTFLTFCFISKFRLHTEINLYFKIAGKSSLNVTMKRVCHKSLIRVLELKLIYPPPYPASFYCRETTFKHKRETERADVRTSFPPTPRLA